jgi:hypothetical protein
MNSFEAAWRDCYLELFPDATFNEQTPTDNDLSAFEESWRQKTAKLFPELSLILKEHKLYD